MIEYNQKLIGSRIRDYRLKKGLTLSNISSLSGIAESSIGQIERGVGKNIELKTILRIANALNVSIDDLTRDCLEIYDIDNKQPDVVKIINIICNEINYFTKEQFQFYIKFLNIFIK